MDMMLCLSQVGLFQLYQLQSFPLSNLFCNLLSIGNRTENFSFVLQLEQSKTTFLYSSSQLPCSQRCRQLAVVPLQHIDTGAHLPRQRVYVRAVEQFKGGVGVAQAIQGALLPRVSVPTQSSLRQQPCECLLKRIGLCAVRVGEHLEIGLGCNGIFQTQAQFSAPH